MAKKKQAPLRAALDNHLGRNYALQKQRKQEKAASKRKETITTSSNPPAHGDDSDIDMDDQAGWEDEDEDEALIEGEDEESNADVGQAEPNVELDSGSESDEEDGNGASDGKGKGGTLLEGLKRLAGMARSANPEPAAAAATKAAKAPKLKAAGKTERRAPVVNGDAATSQPHEDDEEDDDPEANDSDASIPLSDLSSTPSSLDLLPHTRLTINNTTALTRSLSSIALPLATLPFSAHLSTTTPLPTSIPDADDDLNRELSLYAQSLSSVQQARALLLAEDATYPFTRPSDYFAEMVKTDEHMTKVKQKLVDTAAGKAASADARRQRDAKKFGKAVQNERLKERAKAKRDMLEKVGTLKRKRQEGGGPRGQGEDTLFDVAVEEAAVTERKDRAERKRDGGRGGGRGRGRGEPESKRQRKDAKFGFGGKKRFSKSGDAESSGDMRGFSTRKMKGQAGGGGGASRGRGEARGSSARGGGGRGGSKRLGKSRRAAA